MMETKLKTKHFFTIENLYSLVFALMVFAFFAFLYPFHLNYQEQYQMFLFTADYLLQSLAKPGGFSDYLGRFVTQFFFYSWFGAIMIAALLALLQQQIWQIARRLQAPNWYLPLSFVPSVLYWGLLCNENYLMGGLVSFNLVLVATSIFFIIKNRNAQKIGLLLLIPLFYWLAGGTVLVLSLVSIGYYLFFVESKRKIDYLLLFLVLLLTLLMPYLAKLIAIQYPMQRLFMGVNYYRFPVVVPFSVGMVALSALLIAVVLPFFARRIQKPLGAWFKAGLMALVLLPSLVFISKVADFDKEEVMAYDFYARMRKWDQVLALADKKSPDGPLSVACLNLALAQQGQLGNRMFQYYQNGVGGLMPDFVRDYTIPMMAGEVYYHLGFINTAQRFAFEAMEALPDYQKSVRSVMRLAETNIINGHYAVAAKYLKMLQKTLYYKQWASNALQMLNNEEAIAEHPEWGWLRKCRTSEDFLFSEGEKNMMLGILFTQNRSNQMAFEYLLAYCLLNKDLHHFMQYFPLGSSLAYKTVPLGYQEAMVYIWQANPEYQGKEFPYPLSRQVMMHFTDFGKAYQGGKSNAGTVQKSFGNTYWYYLLYR